MYIFQMSFNKNHNIKLDKQKKTFN